MKMCPLAAEQIPPSPADPSARTSRSANFMPAAATRSVTTRDASTLSKPDCAITLAAHARRCRRTPDLDLGGGQPCAAAGRSASSRSRRSGGSNGAPTSDSLVINEVKPCRRRRLQRSLDGGDPDYQGRRCQARARNASRASLKSVMDRPPPGFSRRWGRLDQPSSCATACQPMSRRQKPSGQWMQSTA